MLLQLRGKKCCAAAGMSWVLRLITRWESNLS